MRSYRCCGSRCITAWAGYEDINDALRLARDPAMQAVVGRRALEKQAASKNTVNWFETDVLISEDNLWGLRQLNAGWVGQAVVHTLHQRIILDMHSSESPLHGEHEGAVYNGHFGCVCYHPLFLFNQFGDCEGAMLRLGNVHSAERWRELLETTVERYQNRESRLVFRADAAFAKPEVYEYPEPRDIGYAIRLPANEMLQEHIKHLLKRSVGRPPQKPTVWYHDFLYQVGSWDHPRRLVAKVEWHLGELSPRVGFIVTSLCAKPKAMVHVYNRHALSSQTCPQRDWKRNRYSSTLQRHHFKQLLIYTRIYSWFLIHEYILGFLLLRISNNRCRSLSAVH